MKFLLITISLVLLLAGIQCLRYADDSSLGEYRIVEIVQGRHTHYNIQRKTPIGFWITEHYRFDTPEKARLSIQNLKEKTVRKVLD